MHHYVESGLNQVWLRNGYVEEITAYGPTIAFGNIDSLHRAIALSIIDIVGKLKAEHIRFLRRNLGMSRRRLGDWLGVAERRLVLWEEGRRPITLGSDKLLRLVVKAHLSPHTTLRQALAELNDVDRATGDCTLVFAAAGETWERFHGVSDSGTE